ncbi:MAG: type IV secretion system protein [Plesiomonas shigelloides]
MDMDIAVFSYIGESINAATKTYITDGIQGLIDTIKIFIMLCVAVYISLKGYASITGKSDDVLKDVVIHCVVVVCITGLSLNAANYTTYIIGGIDAWAGGLAQGISKAAGVGGGGSELNVFETLDGLLTEAVKQASYCFAKMSLWDSESWDWIVAAIAVLGTLGAVTLTAGIIIIGSKFLLTLLFLLGPLFLSLACFPATRRFAESWFSKLMENCLVQVFGVAIITLATTIISKFIDYNSLEGEANPLAIAAQIVIVAGIMTFIIRQIPNLAGSLAGGFASGAMTLRDVMAPVATVAGAAAGFLAGRNKAPSDAADVGNRQTWDQQQGNQISRGSSSGESYRNSDEAKKQQIVKDMIAERTRQNSAK